MTSVGYRDASCRQSARCSVGGPASGMPARLTLLQITSYGRRADRLRSLPRAPIKAATRACRCAHRGVIWRASWRRSPKGRWLAGMRRVARGVGTDSRATAAHRLGGGHVHANDGRGGPGWGRCRAWWTGCIGSCWRGRCTFRLARFRLSVTSVFAGPYSAWRG
jgi:hypothetical protein